MSDQEFVVARCSRCIYYQRDMKLDHHSTLTFFSQRWVHINRAMSRLKAGSPKYLFCQYQEKLVVAFYLRYVRRRRDKRISTTTVP
jgi:hypothetical protein